MTPAPDEPTVLHIDVRYSLRGTNNPRSLVFPFYVIPSEAATSQARRPAKANDTDGSALAEPRRPPLPAVRRRRQALHPAALPGVDRPQRLRPGCHADRGRRPHGRPARLPAQPGARRRTTWPSSTCWASPCSRRRRRAPRSRSGSRRRSRTRRAAPRHRDRDRPHRDRGGGGLRRRGRSDDRAVQPLPRAGPARRRQAGRPLAGRARRQGRVGVQPGPLPGDVAALRPVRAAARTARRRCGWTARSTVSASTRASRRWSGRPGRPTAGPPARSPRTPPAA